MTWVILLLEGFGCGFWFARADHRRRHHASLRERLVWGRLPTTTLPVIDDRLRRAAGGTDSCPGSCRRHHRQHSTCNHAHAGIRVVRAEDRPRALADRPANGVEGSL